MTRNFMLNTNVDARVHFKSENGLESFQIYSRYALVDSELRMYSLLSILHDVIISTQKHSLLS
jgi:hypothetical protein